MVSASAPESGLSLERPLAAAESSPDRAMFSLLEALADQTGRGVLVLGDDLNVISFNAHYHALIGFPEGAVRVGTPFRALLDFAARLGYHTTVPAEAIYQNWLERFVTREPGQRLVEFETGLGLLIVYVPFPGGWVLTFEDISERLKTKRALEQQNQQFDLALRHAPNGLCMFDAQNRLVLCNATYRRLYGLPEDLCRPGTDLKTILDFRYARKNGPADLGAYYELITAARRTGEFGIVPVLLEDGRSIRVTQNPMPNGGYVSTHEDVTAALKAQAQIRYLATHDVLTGLRNRAALHEGLRKALAERKPGEILALFYIDLDDFKPVNDICGHSAGDRLIKAVTERFLQQVGSGGWVARLGGDEFVMVQTGLVDRADANQLAGTLVQRIGEPFEIDGHTIRIGASVGIALCPENGQEADVLLKNADLALYRAKATGGKAHHFFETGMDSQIRERRRLTLDLRSAMEAGAFELHYQPVVDLQTNRVTTFEALLRWTHPVRGRVSPADFIPLAEETGLIVQIGKWVIEQACRDASRWPSDIAVAINLSPLQFNSGDMQRTVLNALMNTGLMPSRLEFEITESVHLVDNAPTLAALHEFRAMGARIALDDFGTGYSALSYLRRFPFDRIKIDQSFIRDMTSRSDCAAIVKAVVDLGGALGMTTTAEGVESLELLEIVRAQGCRFAQGYLFSIPRPASAALEMLAMGQTTRTIAAA